MSYPHIAVNTFLEQENRLLTFKRIKKDRKCLRSILFRTWNCLNNPRLTSSDYGRDILFDLQDNKLNLSGEPSYYFWKYDEKAFEKLFSGEARTQAISELSVAIQKIKRKTPQNFDPNKWLIQQILNEAIKYEREVGTYRFLQLFGKDGLIKLLSTKTTVERKALLNTQSLQSLLIHLIDLKVFTSTQKSIRDNGT